MNISHMNTNVSTIHGKSYDYAITEKISNRNYHGMLKARGDIGQIDSGISVEITTQEKKNCTFIEMVTYEGVNYYVYTYNNENVTIQTNQEWIKYGNNKYRGETKDGIPHGYGEMKWSDCSLYNGNWSRGKMCGFGVMTWPSGKRYEGTWENSQMEGVGTMFYPNGSVYNGNFHFDKREGHGVLRQPNGEFYDGLFIDDKPSTDGGFYNQAGKKQDYEKKAFSKPSFFMVIWLKTWRLWAGLACFALAVLFAMWVFDFFSGNGPSHMRVKGIFAPILMVILGVKLIIGFFVNLGNN